MAKQKKPGGGPEKRREPAKTRSTDSPMPASGELTGPFRWILAGVAVLTLAHLLTSFFPGLTFWGIDYWSEWHPLVRLVLAALIALSLNPQVASRIASTVGGLLQQRAGQIIGAALLAVLMIVFRSKGYAYGDGYSFPGYFAGGNMPDINVHLSIQYLDIVVHWVVYRFLVLPMGGDVAMAYAVVAAAAGLAGIWAIVRIARSLSTDAGTRGLIVAAGLTSGATFMFFGHVESYTLVNVSILWMIAFALEAKRERWRIWPAWGMWILAVAFHQLAFILIPAMIWTHWRVWRPRDQAVKRGTAAVALLLGFGFWMVTTYLYRLVGPPIFVPLWSTPDSNYTAFALAHLLDQVNLLLFLSPVGVIGLVSWLAGGKVDRGRSSVGVVALFAATAWYFTFWVDPLIGAFRDWDLLAAFGIPMSIWGAATLALRFPKMRTPRWAWVPLAALSIVHVGGFVATTQDELAVVARIDRMVDEDPHYSARFFEGSRFGPWAAVLARELGRYDLARRHLANWTVAQPDNALAWANLGSTYQRLGHSDSASVCYERAFALDTNNVSYANNLALLKIRLSDDPGAREALENLLELTDTAYAQTCTLGLLYGKTARFDEATAMLERAKKMHPQRSMAYYYAGQLCEVRADTACAIEQFREALARGGESNEDIFKRLTQLYQWSGQLDSAIAVARRWERSFPQSGTPGFLQGTCFYTAGEYDSARVAFLRAETLMGSTALLNYYLGSVERNLGHLDDAKARLRRATEIEPTLTYPYLEMVYMAVDEGDHEGAVAATKAYLNLAPQDSAMSYLQPYLE